MKIHLNGFSLSELSPELPFSEFWSSLEEFQDFTFRKRKHYLGCGSIGDYAVGLLSSTRNNDPEVVLKHDGKGKPYLAVAETADGETSDKQHFNFFAINKSTQVGLVSRYYGAGSVATFGNIFRSRYQVERKQKQSLLKQESRELDDDSNDELRAELDERKKKLKSGDFVVRPFYREGTFETLLSNYSVITELTFDEPSVKESKFQLVRDQLSLDRHVLRFELVKRKKTDRIENKNRAKIIDTIKKLILGRNVESATVQGKTTNGMQLDPLKIEPQVDSFGEFNHAHVVQPKNLGLTEVAKSPFVNEIVEIAKKKPGLFETPTS